MSRFSHEARRRQFYLTFNTLGILLRGRRILGLFEHHTHLLTTEKLAELVAGPRTGSLDFATIFAEDGHGATFAADYQPDPESGFAFVAVTGPHRALARPLGWYEAAPHGAMMLAGPFGLIAAARDKAGRDDRAG